MGIAGNIEKQALHVDNNRVKQGGQKLKSKSAQRLRIGTCAAIADLLLLFNHFASITLSPISKVGPNPNAKNNSILDPISQNIPIIVLTRLITDEAIVAPP
jgi:hypothetical protein